MRSSINFRPLAWLVLGLFCVVFVLSFFVPIYTDEITVKIARAKALFDDLVLPSLYPQCGASYALTVPQTWTPGAFVYWLAYSSVTGPMQLRVMGVLMFIFWLGMVMWFMRQHSKSVVSQLHVTAGIIAMVSLGVLPFMMMVNRAEQVLLIGITFACILPFTVARYPPRSQAAWVFLVALFCLAESFMFYSHPKTLFFVPLLAVSALHLSMASRRVWVGAVMLGGLVLICFESMSFWSRRMYCPDAPILDQILKSLSMPVGLLFTSPTDFFDRGWGNLGGVTEYVRNTLFQPQYQSNWLPSEKTNKLDYLATLINSGVKAGYLVLAGYLLLLLSRRLRTDWHERKLSIKTTIPVALLFGIVVTSFFMVSRNFYESALIVPLVQLLFGLLFVFAAGEIKWWRFHSYMFGFLLVISVLSQMNLIRTFAPYIANQWKAGGQVSEQPLSISSFNFSKVRGEVIETAAHCGIKPGERNAHLVIDDTTYFVFNDAYRPFHAGYVGGFFGRDIGDKNFLSFLNKHDSAGVITRCEKISPEIRKHAIESGDYCCISREEISRSGGADPVVGN